MTTVLSRTFLALLALASVVAAAPGGGARRSFIDKDGVLDVATRVGVRVTPTDVVENELCSSQQLDSHSWSSNHIAFLSQSDFSNGAACGALIKIGTPGHEQLAIVGGTCIDCKTGSLAVSEALFKTFADLASGQFTAAWAFVGDAPESFEASTGILAQEQASVKTIELQARAATNVEQALPVSKSAAATSVATLFKRFDNARMTYYDVGLGACGWSNQPSDFVVAINAAQYNSGRHCGQRVQIRANGKTAIAEVVDECPGCEGHGLDLSEALFSHFAPTGKGVFLASWDFVAAQPTKRNDSTDASSSRLAQPTPSYVVTTSTFPAVGLSKRFDHAQMTYYNVGLGSCGHNNQPSDYVVALNAAQYDSGHHCGQRIQIRANGKTAVAQVVDRCTSCEGHGLDLSKGLFSHFADPNDGVFVATWDFISDHHYQREVASSDATLSRRYDGAHMIHYEVGLGACGWSDKPSDFVVALNSAQYGSGKHCGQQIQIQANGKTAIAQVVDECPGCEGDGLDLSDALFEHFAPSATGEFVGSWGFISGHSHHARNPLTELSSVIVESSNPSTSFTFAATSAPSLAAPSSNPSPLTPRSKQSGANNGPLTWYKDGLGACGWTNQPSDYVVALNSAQYGSGQYCGRRIEITAEGKTAIAEIVDECPGCGAGGLDLSHGLFEHFAPDTKGVLSGSWRFVS